MGGSVPIVSCVIGAVECLVGCVVSCIPGISCIVGCTPSLSCVSKAASAAKQASNLLGGTTSGTTGGKSTSSSGASTGSSPIINVNSGSNMPAITAPAPVMVSGSQIAIPEKQETADVVADPSSVMSPLVAQEITGAKKGGLMQHFKSGGFPDAPGLSQGEQFSFYHPAMGLSPLEHGPSVIAHVKCGGKIVEHKPEFLSEGGLRHFVKGGGTGTSDSVPAMLANGEFVIPADVVSGLGDGSNDSGAKILDEFLVTVRKHKQSHDAKQLPPDSKGPLGYLLEAKKKVK